MSLLGPLLLAAFLLCTPTSAQNQKSFVSKFDKLASVYPGRSNIIPFPYNDLFFLGFHYAKPSTSSQIVPYSPPNYAQYDHVSNLIGVKFGDYTKGESDYSPLNISSRYPSFFGIYPDSVAFGIRSLYLGCARSPNGGWPAGGKAQRCKIEFLTKTAATGGKLVATQVCKFDPAKGVKGREGVMQKCVFPGDFEHTYEVLISVHEALKVPSDTAILVDDVEHVDYSFELYGE